MNLTDTTVRSARPRPKPYKRYDARGLFLLVTPAGGKLWRFRYRHSGKEKLLALGAYPTITLKEARVRRENARRLIEQGIDPAAQRKAMKTAQSAAETFEAVALEWFEKFAPTWVPAHADRIIRRLRKDLFPWIGHLPVAEVTAPALLACLRRIEHRGALETAHRARQNAGQVFRYAVATGRAERDPSGDLRGALPPVKEKHHATITDPKAIGGLLRAIDGYEGAFATQCALRLAPLVFVRPGELRKAEWTEFDLNGAEWRIPAARMKMREPHIVPLPTQAVTILEALCALTGRGRFVFPGARTDTRPMSENAVLAALRRMGYPVGAMTGHGFRSMAATRLNEMGWNRDAIERQLAHAERDHIRAAYNYAEYLPERRRMMQAWADYLDGLKTGADVVALRG